MDNAFFVQIAHARDKLGKEPSGCIVLEIPVVQDVVEQFASRSILENNSDMPFGLDHLMQANNVRVRNASENGNLAVNLGQPRGIVAYTVPLDQLDGNLCMIC